MEPVMTTIAERVKLARERKHWSQAQLALAVECAPSTIGNIEAGTRKAMGTLPKIAKALEVRHEWLAYNEGSMTQPAEAQAPAERSTLSQSAIDIGKLYDMIPEGDLLRRIQAFKDATTAIVAVLERHDSAGPSRGQ